MPANLVPPEYPPAAVISYDTATYGLPYFLKLATSVHSPGQWRAVDAWVDVLSTTFGGSVVRSLDIHQCAPDRIENADLIVLPTLAGTGSGGQFEAIAQVLKECVHPVLFVPSLDGIFERSSS